MRFDAFFAAPGAPGRKFVARAANASASAGLTMRQHSSAFWIDPEQPTGFFINSKPRRGLSARAVRLR
jgi:hypothetical protein